MIASELYALAPVSVSMTTSTDDGRSMACRLFTLEMEYLDFWENLYERLDGQNRYQAWC